MQAIKRKLQELERGDITVKELLRNQCVKLLRKVLFFRKNAYILSDITRKASKNRVNLNYAVNHNLGDMLSPVVVEYMLDQEGICPDKKTTQTHHLYAVGSVLTSGIQDCTVWGSGVISAKLLYHLKNRRLDVRATRGPITRMALMDYGYDVPEVYGDPAILMPEIYMPPSVQRTTRFGLVFHYKAAYDKNEYMNATYKKDCIKLLDIHTENYEMYIRDMLTVDIVISQSLHGIILAESYGVPAVLLKPNDHYLKYCDWYFSTGRTTFPVANSVEEALDTSPPDLPDLTQMRQSLKEAFPYDLYQ